MGISYLMGQHLIFIYLYKINIGKHRSNQQHMRRMSHTPHAHRIREDREGQHRTTAGSQPHTTATRRSPPAGTLGHHMPSIPRIYPTSLYNWTARMVTPIFNNDI